MKKNLKKAKYFLRGKIFKQFLLNYGCQILLAEDIRRIDIIDYLLRSRIFINGITFFRKFVFQKRNGKGLNWHYFQNHEKN
jgi:hypothetical protein